MPFLIDNAAREIALTRSALPDCLHVPVAAVDESAITTYIGEIEQVRRLSRFLIITLLRTITGA